MKKIIILALCLLFSGCALKKNTAEPVPVPLKKSQTAQTVEGEKVWLDTVIETAKSVRVVTRNMDLHDKGDYRNRMTTHNNQLFDNLFFNADEYNAALNDLNPDLKDRMIKSFLLIIQIEIETDQTGQETETEQNRRARNHLKTLKKLAGNRVDLDISALDLKCNSLQACISTFNKTTNERD